MHANPVKSWLAVAVLVTCTANLPHAWGLVQYRLTDLGTLGGDSSYAFGINAGGQVVGSSGSYAYVYDGTMHNLGILGTQSQCFAHSINDGGQIVGGSYGTSGFVAFLYDGTMHTLAAASTSSNAMSINNSGQIVGRVDSGNYTAMHAFFYDGTMHDLGALGGTNSYANDVNASGTIVGYVATHADLGGIPFYYDGTVHYLDPLGGTDALASSINDRGQIVGYSFTSGASGTHPFLYDGTMHDLGFNGMPAAINASGQIVGLLGSGIGHGFVYEDGTMKDLNTLLAPGAAGYTVTDATAINAGGQIVGQCTTPTVHEKHAMLLTPTLATQVTSQTPTLQLCTLPVTSTPPLNGTNSFYVTPSAVSGNVLTQGHVTVDLEQVQQLDPATSLSSTVLTPKITLLKQSPSYAWVPLTIPEGADALTLSFTFHSIDPADFLTIGINDTLLFGEEGKFVIDGAVNSTGSLDVSQWAGQDVTLFLGLNSTGDTPGGTMVIDAMQFQELPEPASLSLLAFGVLGLLARRARRG